MTMKEKRAFNKSLLACGSPADLQDLKLSQVEAVEAERDKVLMEHLPDVRFIARRIHERLPQHVSIEDLYSAGVVGLIDAFGRFDPSRQVKFRSYAKFRIRGAILDSLRTLDWSSRQLRREGRAVEQTIWKLTTRFGRHPSELEIAEELGIDLTVYQQLSGKLKNLEIGTLYSQALGGAHQEELAYPPHRREDDPFFRCLGAEMRELLTGAISSLSGRERLVITLYYYEELGMKEIATILKVTESRISQIHTSAVLHLRARFSNHASRQASVLRADRPVTCQTIHTSELASHVPRTSCCSVG
jgi:RNA polymerase sigma factor for flagellar operon FliA